MKRCSCGFLPLPDATHCPKCGKPVESAANDQEPRYSLGSLRDFTKDWTHLGRKTFTISELAAYVGDDDYGMLHEGARVVEDHPDLLKQEGDRG